MPFIRAARNFLTNPGQHQNHPRYPVMQDTIEFLLNTAVGLGNAVSTDRIIQHLDSQGHNIGREAWQVEVLGYLRENGVFIGSKIGVGIFLIETENDAQEVHNSMRNRINVEQNRLGIIESLVRNAGWHI